MAPPWFRSDSGIDRRSTAGKCQISYLRGGTAETLNMIKTSAVPPRLGQSAVGSPRHRHYRRGTAMTAVVPYKIAVAPPSPQCIRSTTAVQSRKKVDLRPCGDPVAFLLRLWRCYHGATTSLAPQCCREHRSHAANDRRGTADKRQL